MLNSTNKEIPTGSYAVTTVYKIPWKQVKKIPEKTKGKKKSNNKIENLIFSACAERCDDPYWKDIFENASRNKFPRGFMYKNNLLIHKKGTKTQRIEIPDSISEAVSICLSFFKQAAGLMSELDRERMQREISQELLDKYALEKMGWKDIKKEKVRDLLINEFIRNVAIELKLNHTGLISLQTLIHKGFLFKQFTKDDVIFECGRVIGIKGLVIDYDKNTYYIVTPPQTKKVRILRSSTIPIIDLTESENEIETSTRSNICLMKVWYKYLESLSKKIIKPTSTLNIINSLNNESISELSLDNSGNSSN